MAMSGVTVDDECVRIFDEFKKKKIYRYLFFTIENGSKIVVSDKGARDETFEAFAQKFQPSTPCYAAYDFEYQTPDGPREKLVLITWNPDSGKPRPKMLYSSSKDALVQLEGGLLPIQANDPEQLQYDFILSKVKANKSA
jgi:cofilin